MTEIQVLGRASTVVETGERSWYAGPSSPVGRLLHSTDGPMRDTADVRVSCWPEPMLLNPHLDRDGLRRCTGCCRADGVHAGYGVPRPPKRQAGEVLSEELTTFTAAWPLDAEDRKYTPAQLGIVTKKHLQGEAKAAGMKLVGETCWEIVNDGTVYGALVATTDARRILAPAADGRVSA